jgi:hypothetical protein
VNKTLHLLLAPFCYKLQIHIATLIYVSKRVLGSIYPIQFLFKKKREEKKEKKRESEKENKERIKGQRS